MAKALSDFRKRKLLHVFDSFLDTNHSGSIDREDFDISVRNVCMVRGWKDTDPNYDATEQRFFQIWESLKLQAGIDDAGTVSPEEWYQLWADPLTRAGWQQSYMNSQFSLLDTSGDAVIDMMEFCQMYSCYGVDSSESKKAYLLMSDNNKAVVNKEYFSQLWKDFFFSDDPKAPGTHLFGKVSYD